MFSLLKPLPLEWKKLPKSYEPISTLDSPTLWQEADKDAKYLKDNSVKRKIMQELAWDMIDSYPEDSCMSSTLLQEIDTTKFSNSRTYKSLGRPLWDDLESTNSFLSACSKDAD